MGLIETVLHLIVKVSMLFGMEPQDTFSALAWALVELVILGACVALIAALIMGASGGRAPERRRRIRGRPHFGEMPDGWDGQ